MTEAGASSEPAARSSGNSAPRPELWTLDRLADPALRPIGAWVTPSLGDAPWLTPPRLVPFSAESIGLATLVVAGGGSLLDRAKRWRREQAPGLRLVAIPTRWGSGAEASPIVVFDRDGHKAFAVDDAYLPDARIVVHELARTLPEDLARFGIGDALSHAVEGFLSPLADAALREALARVLADMIRTGIGRDPAWFELSARACALQARSSVGLVHGIAHTLEPILATERRDERWGHARLCSLYLDPVLRFVREGSPKWKDLTAAHRVDAAGIEALAGKLHAPADYRTLLPVLERHWRDLLRDPCTRTNAVLVRPASIDFFRGLASG